MKHMLFGKFVASMLGVLAIAVFAGGTALAGSPDINVSESATLRLSSTGLVRSSLKAFARLQLIDDQETGSSLRVSIQVESDGLRDNELYGLWVSTPEGGAVLLDTGRADEEFDVDPDTGDEDREVILNLRGHLMRAPFQLTTLQGLTIDIREHAPLGLFGDPAPAPAVATGTVGASDLN